MGLPYFFSIDGKYDFGPATFSAIHPPYRRARRPVRCTRRGGHQPAGTSRSSVAGSADRSGSSAALGIWLDSPSRLIHTHGSPSAAAGSTSWHKEAATWTWPARSALVRRKEVCP